MPQYGSSPDDIAFAVNVYGDQVAEAVYLHFMVPFVPVLSAGIGAPRRTRPAGVHMT